MKNLFFGFTVVAMSMCLFSQANAQCEGYSVERNANGDSFWISYQNTLYPAQRRYEYLENYTNVDTFTAYVPAGKVTVIETTVWYDHYDRVQGQYETAFISKDDVDRELVCKD